VEPRKEEEEEEEEEDVIFICRNMLIAMKSKR
jgi:hypothetical protein